MQEANKVMSVSLVPFDFVVELVSPMDKWKFEKILKLQKNC